MDIRMNTLTHVLKAIDQFKTENKTAQQILEFARITLEMNPIGAESEKDDIFMMNRIRLPSVQVLFDDSFLKATFILRVAKICYSAT